MVSQWWINLFSLFRETPFYRTSSGYFLVQIAHTLAPTAEFAELRYPIRQLPALVSRHRSIELN